MKTQLLPLGIFLVPFMTSCQTIKVRTITSLPQQTKESSGLVIETPNSFWTHNDSGDEAVLYQFDSSGTLIKNLKISNATHIDWEEMQIDANGNLYIGDFGNNAQQRRDLAIYKVPNFKNQATTATALTAEKIEFHYADQVSFPPADSLKHFDAEAMLVNTDSIFIFTKDFETQPYVGKTRIYRLPNKTGKQIAQLVDIIKTDDSWKFKGAITGAAKSTDGKIILLAYLKLYIFTEYQGTAFWRGRLKALDFNILETAQREAIGFAPMDNCTLFITSEEVRGLGGNLSTVNICDYLTHNNNVVISEPQVTLFPTPSVYDVQMEIKSNFLEQLYLKIYNSSGHEIGTKLIPAGENKIILENSFFPVAGMYFYRLFQNDRLPLKTGKIIIIH